MTYYRLVLAAWLRGVWYRWPDRPDIPAGYHGVSCSLEGHNVKDMYRLGWVPYCFQRSNRYGCHGIARFFIVKDKDEVAP